MSERYALMIPRPTNFDPAVMRAMIRTTESHVSEPLARADRRVRRHKSIAEAFRKAMTVMGLRLVTEKGYAADTVTGVYYPERIDDITFRQEMAKNNVVVARGVSELEGRIFRVGHMGIVNGNDIIATVAAIERTMKKMGHRFEYSNGCRAAQLELERI